MSQNLTVHKVTYLNQIMIIKVAKNQLTKHNSFIVLTTKNTNAYDNNHEKTKFVLKIQPCTSINAFRLLVWAETAKQILGQLIHIFCNN